MKILILISNFIDHNLVYRNLTLDWQLSTFNSQLNEFLSYKNYSLDIKIFTTHHRKEYDLHNIETILFPFEVATKLPYCAKEWLKENKNVLSNYDYVLFTEDDLLIKEQQLTNVINYQKLLDNVNSSYKIGFIRFEKKSNGAVVYIDQHPAHSVHRGGSNIIKQVIMENGIRFFEPWNIHSGCWLLSVADILSMIENNTFQTSFHNLNRIYHGPLESAATEIYLDYIKLYPENVEDVAIEHMCDKYSGVTKKEIIEEITTHRLNKIYTTPISMPVNNLLTEVI